MMNLKEFYILGLPVETDIGQCSFIKVKEYPDYFMDLQVLSLSKLHLINKYSEINKDGSLNEFIEEMKKYELFELVFTLKELKESYIRLFTKLFNDPKSILKINKDNFHFYRKLIMDMNCLKEEVVNPNPEIQRAIERSKRLKAIEGDKLEFADIVSSVVGFNGLTYQNINEFTVYQLYMTFYRIAQIKNYDTSTLFATVSEKVKIEGWSKHINLYQEDKHFISQDEFKKTTGSVFSE